MRKYISIISTHATKHINMNLHLLGCDIFILKILFRDFSACFFLSDTRISFTFLKLAYLKELTYNLLWLFFPDYDNSCLLGLGCIRFEPGTILVGWG